MLVKGLQATAAINTTQRHDQLHMKSGEKKHAPRGGICLYYSYRKEFKQHFSINSPIFSVVCIIYLQSWLQRPKAAVREHLLLTSTKHKLLVHVPKTANKFKESTSIK